MATDLVFQDEANRMGDRQDGVMKLPTVLIRNLQAETSEIQLGVGGKGKEVEEDVWFFERGGRRIVESGCGPLDDDQDGEEEEEKDDDDDNDDDDDGKEEGGRGICCKSREELVVNSGPVQPTHTPKPNVISNSLNGTGPVSYTTTSQRLVEKIVAYKPETTPSMKSELISKRDGVAPAAEIPDEPFFVEGWGDKIETCRNVPFVKYVSESDRFFNEALEDEEQEKEEEERYVFYFASYFIQILEWLLLTCISILRLELVNHYMQDYTIPYMINKPRRTTLFFLHFLTNFSIEKEAYQHPKHNPEVKKKVKWKSKGAE